MKKKTSSKKTIDLGNLHALVWKEDDLFVAKAVEIEVASQGTTKKEAVKNLQEAIHLFFTDESISKHFQKRI